jgi:CheY-like chemotaxis protein
MTRALLIVDDNEAVRESLRFLFMHRGYITAVASNGAEALALAEQQAFDGALVDVNMPGINGIAVCRSLHERAAQTGHKLAVWMMTGARTSALAQAAAEAGALALLAKPFDFDDLFRRFDEQFRAAPPAIPGS